MDQRPELPEEERPLLIVDDEREALVALGRLLERLGIKTRTIEAHGGESALAYLRESAAGKVPHPAMVLLDLEMPGVSGFDVLAWMNEQGLFGRMTVAVLGASDDPKDVARAMQLGAHSYMTKPPRPDVLADLVNSSLRIARRKATPPTEKAGGQGEVLIVDDSAFARRSARRIAEEMGYAVGEAANGDAALRYCATNRPDLILLDMVMAGGLYGIDILPRLRRMAPEARILMVTSDIQEMTEQAVLAAGADGLIRKPLTEAKLASLAPSQLRR